ncbi:MAG: hypothetical protein ACTHNP_12725 [Solirubrobacterales bacterium]
MNRRRLIGIGAVLVVVVLAIWVAGLASSSSGPGPAPFSVAESEVRAECMTGTFVPEEAGLRIGAKGPPGDWRQIEEAPGAMPAERGAVRVTLRPKQGRPGTKITLTGVEFKVFNLGLRPTGSIFYRPCNRHPVGAAVETDLDGFSHKIIGSAQSGALAVGFHLPRHSSPIRFPWTVSLSKPLNLYLVVQARDIWADWIAHISWTGESSHGVIQVDNGGKKYRIVDGQGTGWSKPGPDGRWSESGSAAWIGVE